MDLDGINSDEEPLVSSVDNIQPYQFEPIRKSSEKDNEKHQSDNSSESDGQDSDHSSTDQNANRTDNLAWCDCEQCQHMPTHEESLCCKEIPPVEEKVEEIDLTCITEHEGFTGNCLNRHVIEVSMYEFIERDGPIDYNEPINELYRYIAYRRFTRWIHHFGKYRRKVIPACAVKAIRAAYPSDDFTGFKYARP